MTALSADTRRRLAACSSATLSTQLFKRGLRSQVLQGVSRLTPGAPTLVGEAFTLRNIPAREDIDHIGVYDNPEHPQRSFPVFCKAPAAPISLITQHAVESNVPIACGGVAVYPGDVIVGDAEGVVVLPRGIADAVAADAYEQEKLEEFVQLEIAAGRPLPGVYPPNAETKARYEKWRGERT